MSIMLNAMVELSQVKIIFVMENIIMCDFVCLVAREVWCVRSISIFVYFLYDSGLFLTEVWMETTLA